MTVDEFLGRTQAMAIFTNEHEFFVVLSKMITKKVRGTSESVLTTIGLEEVIRGAARGALKELLENKMIPDDPRLPPESLANLIDISLDEAAPKINLWPLVAVLYPLANIKEVDGVKLVNSDGGTLDEAVNGGRYIDLS